MRSCQGMVDTVAELQACGMSATVFDNKGGGIFNNGHVAIVKDLIFGLSVWDGAVWFPMSNLDADDRSCARRG